MALTYASPGVYVEEVDRGAKPIEAAGASMAAFVGITAEASLKATDPATGERTPVESRLNKATLVTSWGQYQDIFGSFTSGAYLPDIVTTTMAAALATSPAFERSRKMTRKLKQPKSRYLPAKPRRSRSLPMPPVLAATPYPSGSSTRQTKMARRQANSLYP